MNQQNPNRKGRSRGGRRRGGKNRATDMWRAVPPLPELEPIAPATDPSSLLRSLGDPPLQGQGAVAAHYIAAVLERAAGSATALAFGAGVLADETTDTEDDDPD